MGVFLLSKISAAALLFMTLPLTLPALVLSRIIFGQALFFQKRIGFLCKPFTIVKIRSLPLRENPGLRTHNLGHSASAYSKILRLSKVDELVQLVNVLCGSMEIVGPRPGLEVDVELTSERLKRNCFAVKPGITGLSQVLGYSMNNPRNLARIDKVYVNNASWKLDALIIVATVFSLFGFRTIARGLIILS